MKSTNIFFLLFPNFFKSSISDNQTKLSKFFFIALAFLAIMPIQKTVALDEVRYNEYPITPPQYNTSNPYGTIDINFMLYSHGLTYNCVRNLTVSYLSPTDNTTYIKLFDYSYGESGNNYGFTTTTFNVVSGTFNTLGKISSTLDPSTQITVFFSSPINIPGFYYNYCVKWDFPPCLTGKKITLKIEGNWQQSFNTANWAWPFSIIYELSAQNNPTTPLSITPQTDGKDKFIWKNTGKVSRFVLYSDNLYSNKIDSVDVSPSSSVTDSVSKAIAVSKVNLPQSYYIQQIYNVPGLVNSSNNLRYINNLGFLGCSGLPYPANLKLNSNYSQARQQIDLKWEIVNKSTSAVVYHVKRGSTFITPVGGTPNLNYTDSFNTTALQNWSSYKYTVLAAPKGWARDNISSNLGDTCTISTSPTIPNLKDFKLVAHPTNGTTAAYMELNWDPNQWNLQNVVKIYHRASTAPNFTLLTTMAAGASTYTDNTVTDNSKHFYKLEVDVFGRIFSKIDSETVVKKVAFKSIKASKNTIGDRIQLSWEIDRLDLCDRFEIYRSFSKDSLGVDVQSSLELVNQLSAQTVYNTWDDRTAAPGMVYQYMIKAYKTGLDGETRTTLSNTDIGFRMSVGTVTGRITFGSGTAVENVSLYVNSSALDNNLLYKSLKFNGDDLQKAEISLTKAQHGCIKNGFSFQSWITSTRPKTYTPVIEVSKEYSIGLRNDSVLAFIGSTFNTFSPSLKCKLDSTINENSYFHLTVTLGSNDSLKVYLNGIPVKSAFTKVPHTSTCSFVDEVLDSSTGSVTTPRTKSYFGNKTDETNTAESAFSGNIDDVRLWSRSISAPEIAGNYNRYLVGNESGLIGYWPMDEGINSNAFDCSKTNQTYNEHHIKLTKTFTSTNVPSKEQLAIKGITDGNGNYIIRGIPFSGDGSTYSIQPILGTHKFDPTQQVCFISQTSLVHDAQNFEDKSSFPVKVKVTYENTTYPVEGVSFYVDENPCVLEAKLIKTDNKGIAILDVPIGNHYIRAELNGHEFLYGGRYPEGVGLFNVNQASAESTMATGLTFTDITQVTVAGRVVGGVPQSKIPVGFGRKVTVNTALANKSVANIGQATITLQPTKYANTYSLASNASRTLPTDGMRFSSVATITKDDDKITIKTDPVTGEYMAKLPPIDWTVLSVTTLAKDNSTIDVSNKKQQSFTTNPLLTNFDTLKIDNKIDTFNYNVKRIFTYRVEPSIEVSDLTSGTPGAFGEKNYYVLNKLTGKNDTLNLYDADLKYKFSKPVFVMGKKYIFKIKAFERYYRSDKDSTDVPLSGADVTVENAMGKLVKTTNPDDTANDSIPEHKMSLNKNGFIYYEFLAGFPNLITTDHSLGVKVKMNYENADYYWNKNGNFSGIVLGSEPIAGTNFVTEGPLVPLVVLRDPPGSESYAYMETGTTLTYNVSSQTDFNQSSSGSLTVKAGADVTMGFGFGVFTVQDAKWTNDTHIGFEQDFSKFTGKSNEKSLTLTERIQTSSSPDFVGSNGDVYIGTSTNVLISECNVLDIDKVANEFVLQKSVQNRSNIKAKTEFRFSQNEILTAQIPMWRKKFSTYLIQVTKAEFDTRKNNNSITAKNQYITYLAPSDPNYGVDKTTYAVLRPAANLKLHDEVDSIASQINNWQNVILSNESTKFNAKNNKNYDVNNISFDAGASVERSYTYSDNTTTSSGKSSSASGIVGTEGGFALNGFGIGYAAELKIGGGVQSGNESSTSKTTTFGYVLSDPDADNRFSINVYRNKFLSTDLNSLKTDTLTAAYADKTLGSHIFQVAGGQTSCPYERVDSSLFYTDNNKLVQLGNGTQAIEAPFIRIKSNSKTDVPTGKDATYSLELSSNSIVPTSRAYMLSVDDTSNPDGAIISIDGTPLTGGRLFYVAPGEILTKTLTLHQTKLDVLEYKGIKLQFSSPCDNSISAEQIINATYVPSCSDLDLTLDHQTLNTVTGPILKLSMKNFNQEFKNFLGLSVEYKMEGETNWHEKVFAKNLRTQKLITNSSAMLLNDSTSGSFDYELNTDGLADGNYLVRAKTLCKDGINIINNITVEYPVVKDMVLPASMGQPSPSNGILTPESEVSVTFNENIQTGNLINDNFEVKGVLNGVTLQHAEGLSLNGTAASQAYTDSPITLQNGSFSIEGWLKTASDCNTMGNIFTIGAGADKVALNMKKDAVEVRINDQIVGTKSIATALDWQYISMSYNANNKLMQVHLMSSNSASTIISTTLSSPVNPVGRLMVGSGFKGNINQVVIWNENRAIQDLSDMNEAKSGKETNVIGYWPMDEAYGKIATDKANSRNMTVNSSWFVEPSGYSASFNGTDQSLLIKSSSIPMTKKDNFSIEFWVKGNAQINKTIFSCGKGIGDIDSSDKLSIGINNSGELNLNSKGNTYIVPEAVVLDGSWHHFAMSVLRNGNSNVYIDGQQKLQVSSSKIGGLASDSISLGSRRYSDSIVVNTKKTTTIVKDQYFNGMLDEVRIWNSALGAENFRLDMRSKLTGTESGLIAYYPFEEQTKDSGGQLQITSSFNDCSSKKSGTGIYTNFLSSSASLETPGIKVPRPKEDVSFSYTASENKIIFNIDAPLAKIENCMLEFAVNKVYDLNGNKLVSPIKWTAFVNNNRLNWETGKISIVKQVLDEYTFKAVIVNNSGKYENFIIDGLPSWLSVNAASGKLNPLEKKELTFTVDKATNIGSYESRIILTGNNNMKDMLPVSLKITGTSPDWSVSPYEFESTMSLIGQIKIDGVYQEDSEDILAAFNGTKCVGVASPQFNKSKNSYIVYMDIYGDDTENGKALTFSLWDAGTGRIYPTVDVIGNSINYLSSSIIGSVNNPKAFNATDKIEQQLSLKLGWNWISTNVVNTNPTLISQFKSNIGSNGVLLKSRFDGFIDYSNGNWIGDDFDLHQNSMYLLKMNQDQLLKLTGNMAKPVDFPVTINQFWNYIGYVPQFVAPVKDALSTLNAKEGDQIKSQFGFASYSDGIWYGSLQYMMPGLGYMYYSNNTLPTTFNYPSQYISQSKAEKLDVETETMKWSVNVNKYQMSMTITAIATIDKKEVSNGNMQLGLFIGDECRGTATLKYVDAYQRYMAFLQIWGNTDDLNSKITFRSYDPTINQEMTADQSLSFVPDNITGSPVTPYQIDFVISGTSDLNMNLLKIYPNPVIDIIHFNSDPGMIEHAEIIDNIGRILVSDNRINNNSLNVGNLIPGVYTLRIKCNGKTSNQMFVKK